MTERGRGVVERAPDSLRIGPSSLRWDRDSLLIDIEERTMPWLRRVTGTIRVTPTGGPGPALRLQAEGRHIWQPIAPQADIEVTLNRPSLSWRGKAYLDCNHGMEPLQAGFRRWNWARAHLSRRTVVLYDLEYRGGTRRSIALGFESSGGAETLEILPEAELPRTRWRLDRPTRADAGFRPIVTKTLEDGPFYSRSLVSTKLYGETGLAFHESLDLDRFRAPIVRAMLPFRMPRRGSS